MESITSQTIVLCTASAVFGAMVTFIMTRQSKADEVKPRINTSVEMEKEKVVHIEDMEDLASGDKKCYCRCWKSAKFPYCDGAHVKHNKETGDNIGPLICKKA